MSEIELVFPCEYAIKVIGRDENNFEHFVRKVITRHVPDVSQEDFSSRNSRENNYVSVTVDFMAQSRDQLNALYVELGADPRVKVIL